jgi:hypothetical protein
LVSVSPRSTVKKAMRLNMKFHSVSLSKYLMTCERTRNNQDPTDLDESMLE